LTGIFQLSWRRKTFFVHAKVQEVQGSVALEEQQTVNKLLDVARSRGLLETSR